jgi:hypothetical protein
MRTSIGEHAVGGGEVLFSVQSFFFEAVELGIASDFQRLSVFSATESADCGVAVCFACEDLCYGCHLDSDANWRWFCFCLLRL